MIFILARHNRLMTFFRQNGAGKRRIKHGSSGFTIVELLIIFAILAVLSAIALFSYHQLIDKARYVSAVEDIRNIASLLDSFFLDNDTYPNDLNQIGVGSLLDPWGNPYQYLNYGIVPKGKRRKDGKFNPINSFYDLWSNGTDGESQQSFNNKQAWDDIVRAQDGAFIGLAKEFDEMLYG